MPVGGKRFSNPILSNISIIIFLLLSNSIFSDTPNDFPYKIDLKTDGPLLSGAIITTGLALYLKNNVQYIPTESDIFNLDRNKVWKLERWVTYNHSPTAATFSDISVGISAVSPFLLILNQSIKKNFRNALIITIQYSEVFLLTKGITACVKSLANRMRPFMYTDLSLDEKQAKAESKSANRSFFSGHTSAAFSSAVFFARLFGDIYPESKLRPYIWGSSLALATITASLRVAAGKHYPSDVIVGAVVGSFIGYLIPALHKTMPKNLMMSPLIGHNQLIFSLNYSF